MLTSANGTSTALIAKITVNGVTPNHMIDSSVQPIAENELRNGPMRRSIASRSTGTVIRDQREQRSDDERHRDRRADMEQRRAEMAEIARSW